MESDYDPITSLDMQIEAQEEKEEIGDPPFSRKSVEKTYETLQEHGRFASGVKRREGPLKFYLAQNPTDHNPITLSCPNTEIIKGREQSFHHRWSVLQDVTGRQLKPFVLICLMTRLHISPFNEQLLPIVLPTPLLEKTSNISFHTIETFPEKNYGYLDLPEAEADRLRKKLNGSTLKGSKMRVEVARPKKGAKATKEKEVEDNYILDRKVSKQKSKGPNDDGVISGHELQGRKVKRGWTEPAANESKPSKRRSDKEDKKVKPKASSFTDESECLFKTKLPPTAAASTDLKDGKAKKRKRGESSRDTVVHEFANTTKHATFLRDDTGSKEHKSTREYIEGKGWVDEDGNVVEPEPKRRRSKAKPEPERIDDKDDAKPRSRRSSRLEVPSVQVTAAKTRSAQKALPADETSSSGTSSDSDGGTGDAQSDAELSDSQKSPVSGRKRATNKYGLALSGEGDINVDRVERLSITRSSASPPSDQGSPPTSAPKTKEVHPLETLFKRPNTAASHTSKKPNLEVSTSFSLGDPDQEQELSQGLLIPQTPFTQQDIRQRRQRSAAPTPDTAAPGRTFGKLWEGNSDISDDDDEEEEDEAEAASESKDQSATPDIKEENAETEFSKQFWEQRGDNNRAWKRRRREAAKGKRQKDNKARKERF